ncbi:MAG: hypothetical protein IJ164_09280, partial [Duodenibacillus sp.]|nr:hypothetical protein [Duodenibacillus sp.]
LAKEPIVSDCWRKKYATICLYEKNQTTILFIGIAIRSCFMTGSRSLHPEIAQRAESEGKSGNCCLCREPPVHISVGPVRHAHAACV